MYDNWAGTFSVGAADRVQSMATTAAITTARSTLARIVSPLYDQLCRKSGSQGNVMTLFGAGRELAGEVAEPEGRQRSPA